jgi:hypothetical protein
MWNLTRSELLRFRSWTLAFGALHLLALVLFNRMVDPLQQPRAVYQMGIVFYALTGLLFGLYQMSGYRRESQWLYLLHRPLSAGRIFLALLSAIAMMAVVAVVLPVLVTLVGIDLFSARVVDVRHYLLPPYALVIVLSFYLVGCYAMLSPGKAAIFALVLPGLFLANQATGAWRFVPALLGLLWLAWLVRCAFKPDRTTHPEQPLASLATAVPLQLGLYLALVGIGSIVYQYGLIFVGSHPRTGTAPRGGYTEATWAKPANLLEAGLGTRSDAESNLWREQIRIAELVQLQPELEEFPTRHELANLMPLEWDDTVNQMRWTFSHDQMLFHGVRLDTNASGGWLGTQGVVEGEPDAVAMAERFSSPPYVFGERYLMTGQRLYQFDAEQRKVHLRVALEEGEVFATSPQKVGNQLVMLSNRHLYFFDGRAFERETGTMTARMKMAVPGDLGNLYRVDLAELLEGYLVSFTFGKRVYDGEGDAWQVLLRLDGAGRSEVLNRRELGGDFPVLFRHKALIVSPLLHLLKRHVLSAFAEANPLETGVGGTERSALPPVVLVTTALLTLLSMAASAWWLQTQPMSRQRKWVWFLAIGAVGLPGLLSLVLLHPRRESVEMMRVATA